MKHFANFAVEVSPLVEEKEKIRGIRRAFATGALVVGADAIGGKAIALARQNIINPIDILRHEASLKAYEGVYEKGKEFLLPENRQNYLPQYLA